MSNLVVRALSGAVFVALMLGAIYFDRLTTVILFQFLVVIGLLEFSKMANRLGGIQLNSLAFVTCGAAFFALGALQWYLPSGWNALYFPLIVFVSLAFVISSLFWKGKSSFNSVSVAVFGWVYIVIPFYVMVLIRDHVEGEGWKYLFAMFVLIWTNDTFAYLTGRVVGRTKLFERISPKKTWEGTIGGIFFTILAGILLSFLFEESMVKWIVLSIPIAVSAIFGDLFESMLKRSAGVKDSGHIMPGHGGVLDRFDAVLFAAPVFLSLWLMLS